MNKKRRRIKVTIKFSEDIDCKCRDTKICIEENLKKMT